MPVVTVRVNARDYQIACDNGQEEDLRQLANEVDDRVCDLLRRMGQNPGDFMALLLAAITMADELAENKKALTRMADDLKRQSGKGGEGRIAQMEAAMATTLEDIAARIEKIADSVEIG